MLPWQEQEAKLNQEIKEKTIALLEDNEDMEVSTSPLSLATQLMDRHFIDGVLESTHKDTQWIKDNFEVLDKPVKEILKEDIFTENINNPFKDPSAFRIAVTAHMMSQELSKSKTLDQLNNTQDEVILTPSTIQLIKNDLIKKHN
ncbi:hypothetical protein [Veillonella sp.]|uniref:hypothetical protein n=1 Tax=Veillonella sp. TaxID=1926307 RepID=UPI0025D1FF75|nr:hypothetical protein [Veillonella sp.]